MNEVLLFFILKYKGNWIKIYQALENREKIGIEELINVNSKIKCHFISVVKENYPESLKRIYKPPFGLFVLGNIENLSMQKTTLVGEFNYNDILPISAQEDHALVVKITKNNLKEVINFAKRGINLILICSKGIKKVIDDAKSLLEFENILLVSEHYNAPNSKFSSQPFQRILMGLSSSTIVNYTPNISDIKLLFEIAKQEELNLYNFRNCPKNIVKKYNIKQIDEFDIYANFKN